MGGKVKSCVLLLKWVGDPNLTSASAKSPCASQSLHTAMPGSESLLEVKNFHSGLLYLSGLLRLCSCFTRQSTFSGSRALAKVARGSIMGTTSPTGSPPSALVLGAPGRTPSAPSREMGCSAICACVWTSRCALQCHRVWKGYPKPAAIHVKRCIPHYKSLRTVKETP